MNSSKRIQVFLSLIVFSMLLAVQAIGQTTQTKPTTKTTQITKTAKQATVQAPSAGMVKKLDATGRKVIFVPRESNAKPKKKANAKVIVMPSLHHSNDANMIDMHDWDQIQLAQPEQEE